MTGQVKEDCLARFCELGARVESGTMRFDPRFFESSEFLTGPSEFLFEDVTGQSRSIPLDEGEFAFTLCQTPIIYHRANSRGVRIRLIDQTESVERDDLTLTRDESQSVFQRRGQIARIDVYFCVDDVQPEQGN